MMSRPSAASARAKCDHERAELTRARSVGKNQRRAGRAASPAVDERRDVGARPECDFQLFRIFQAAS